MKRPERVAAVDKIEGMRKPEDFVGHRNRTPAPNNGMPEQGIPLFLFVSLFIKLRPKGFEGVFVSEGIYQVAHSVLRAGDDQQPPGGSAGLEIFVGHLDGHKFIVRSVDEQHRSFASGQRL